MGIFLVGLCGGYNEMIKNIKILIASYGFTFHFLFIVGLFGEILYFMPYNLYYIAEIN